MFVVPPDGGQPTACEPQNDLAAFKPEGPVPSRLALGGRGAYSGRCWGSPVRQKKKHTGRRSHVEPLIHALVMLRLCLAYEWEGTTDGSVLRVVLCSVTGNFPATSNL